MREHAPNKLDRRTFLAGLMASASAAARSSRGDEPPPVRALTRGPKFHWFGYYDKLEFDPTGRYVLGMAVGFEHRSPRPDDVIEVGMVDLHDQDRWIPLGTSRAWCWQQGCMLQWIPGSKSEVIWNDRVDDRFVSRILNVETRAERTIPAPIYALSPDATWAVAPDFRRLHDTRPGYGYAGIPDPGRDQLAPDDAGIWRTDLKTGQTRLLFSFRRLAGMFPGNPAPREAKHWFNHLLVSPDGSRFAFLHRWQGPGDRGFITRLLTCDPDGGRLHVLDPHRKTSHFIWRDPNHILAWAFHPSHGEKFYLYQDLSDRVEVVAPDVMTVNGHCTYLPGTDSRWILNDTYPDRQRLQHPYLYDTQRGTRHALGAFLSPPAYTGEWRCDTHPRSSPDGRSVVIDSPHDGHGRQLYLIDVSRVIA
ncbi:MAG: hypothetical protein U0794_03350 [Isosphaeraceae bacterium]